MALGLGRRLLLLIGLTGLSITLFVIGFIGISNNSAASTATGALMLVWALFYQCSVG